MLSAILTVNRKKIKKFIKAVSGKNVQWERKKRQISKKEGERRKAKGNEGSLKDIIYAKKQKKRRKGVRCKIYC